MLVCLFVLRVTHGPENGVDVVAVVAVVAVVVLVVVIVVEKGTRVHPSSMQ